MPTYGMRLRVRSTKGLTCDEQSIEFDIGETRATLTAPDGKTLRQTPWFILKAGGFPSAEDASSFGQRLRTAILVAAVRRWWGVDVGEDKATSGFFKGITDALEEKGLYVRPNIHGLDVYEERPGTHWSGLEATLSVSADPKALTKEVVRLLLSGPPLEPQGLDAVRLLNEALISQEAAAQLVLAIAAVEMLAQGEEWTARQRDALERLATAAETDDRLTPQEREEVALTLRKSVYRMSVRQSHKRLLTKLGLGDLWKKWDNLYGQRSAILHGLTYSNNATRSEIVAPALRLCGRIVLTAIAHSVPGAADALDEVMPLPD